MNKIINKYLIIKFMKVILNAVLIFFSLGIILNLFEEIEFFKNLNLPFTIPLILSLSYVPTFILELLPFIIFLSSMYYFLNLRSSKDLLSIKVFGYSNVKIISLMSIMSFLFGLLILIMINPVTSNMVKYYEKTKSNYSIDIDHLISFNKNGLWIKENLNTKKRIISAEKPDGVNLINVTIFHLDEKFNLIEKINSKKVNIENNDWVLNDVTIFKNIDGVMKEEKISKIKINSIYNHEKITSLFKNFNTMSFLDLVLNYQDLLNNGYNKSFLKQSLHSMLTLPFFLLLMTALAAVLTMYTLKKSNNFQFTILGLIICVLIFYLKDLSLALGQTDRIPLILAVWAPIMALSLFISIGVLQINEK